MIHDSDYSMQSHVIGKSAADTCAAVHAKSWTALLCFMAGMHDQHRLAKTMPKMSKKQKGLYERHAACVIHVAHSCACCKMHNSACNGSNVVFRREEELESLEKTAPSGGVWGSMQQPPWWLPLPLTAVGSVADPQVAELIQNQNKLGLHASVAGSLTLPEASPAAPEPFQLTASTRPFGLIRYVP